MVFEFPTMPIASIEEISFLRDRGLISQETEAELNMRGLCLPLHKVNLSKPTHTKVNKTPPQQAANNATPAQTNNTQPTTPP